MKLIIAEKPSLGKNIVNAIGSSKFKWNDGYFESSEYIVTWGFGHLFGLVDIEDYSLVNKNDREKAYWTLEGLPFCPQHFRFDLKKKPGSDAIDSGVKKQFNTISKLIKRADVESIIHAGDADREGEIIIRTILDKANNKKPVYRLWLPEQTEGSIRKALANMKNDSAYNNLADEGYARTYIDWLYGVNLTRLATLKSGTLLRVGRVIVPIVEAIYTRDLAIRNFVPEHYLSLVSKAETKGEVITLTSKNAFPIGQRDAAEKFCKDYNSLKAIVTDVKTEKKVVKPKRLFSLSTLQGLLGKKYKMTPKESLSIIQGLYEQGYVTYPRTNTEFLANAESARINIILKKLENVGYIVSPKDGNKSIYDDSKIESHSALTITSKIATEKDLKEREWLVYSTIMNRFLAVFCDEDCEVSHTTIEISLGDKEKFALKGDVVIKKGWTLYEENSFSEKILPPLSKGDRVNVDFKVVEKETSPPKHFTSDSLSKYLKNPFRKEMVNQKEAASDEEVMVSENSSLSKDDDEEYKAIFEGVELGTEATRTSIIEHAIQSKYIQLKNDTYTILPAGERYIESLRKLGLCISKEKTAEIGRTLKKVYRGEIGVYDSVALTFVEIENLFRGAKGVSLNKETSCQSRKDKEYFGKCPLCGSDIEKNKFGDYGCSNWRNGCKFKIKGIIAGKKITESTVRTLLSKGRQVSLLVFRLNQVEVFLPDLF